MIRFQVEAEIWGPSRVLEKGYGLESLVSYAEKGKTGEQVLGYKLSAGLYIFYATESVLKEGVVKGLIFPPGKKLRKIFFRDMASNIGMWLHELLPEALRNTTCGELAAALEQTNKRPAVVTVRVYDAWRQRRDGKEAEESQPYLMEELKLNMAARQVLSCRVPSREECFEHSYFPIFQPAKSYEDYIDILARRICRHYRNSGDIFEAYQANDFYDMDRFLQRLYRLEFVFEPEQGEKVAAE